MKSDKLSPGASTQFTAGGVLCSEQNQWPTVKKIIAEELRTLNWRIVIIERVGVANPTYTYT